MDQQHGGRQPGKAGCDKIGDFDGWMRAYYDELQREYQRKRDFIVPVLQQAGFKCSSPDGAYYVMCDISTFGFSDFSPVRATIRPGIIRRLVASTS